MPDSGSGYHDYTEYLCIGGPLNGKYAYLRNGSLFKVIHNISPMPMFMEHKDPPIPPPKTNTEYYRLEEVYRNESRMKVLVHDSIPDENIIDMFKLVAEEFGGQCHDFLYEQHDIALGR